ncbi:hypothetical protein [Streptomyces sp. NPDC056061]|uniref:hypothetical protein n=1 Tax=Streptomyces sp. NPDC056061 TaxID=3345700 RepID=UPI0035D8C10F
MIILTGPQRTPDEVGDLTEVAGFLGAVILDGDEVRWALADVDVFYRTPGWEHCTRAVTDVAIAEACGWPIKDLTGNHLPELR